jgi:hypothetical protein
MNVISEIKALTGLLWMGYKLIVTLLQCNIVGVETHYFGTGSCIARLADAATARQ